MHDSRTCGASNCNQKVNMQIAPAYLADQRVIYFCSDSCRMRFENKDARTDADKTDARVY